MGLGFNDDPGCHALKDRDRWIGWRASQRVEQLKLVVPNRRFLVLAPKGASPNRASPARGAALRELPAQWRERFGYRPLLAESFTDPKPTPRTSSGCIEGTRCRVSFGASCAACS